MVGVKLRGKTKREKKLDDFELLTFPSFSWEVKIERRGTKALVSKKKKKTPPKKMREKEES